MKELKFLQIILQLERKLKKKEKEIQRKSKLKLFSGLK